MPTTRKIFHETINYRTDKPFITVYGDKVFIVAKDIQSQISLTEYLLKPTYLIIKNLYTGEEIYKYQLPYFFDPNISVGRYAFAPHFTNSFDAYVAKNNAIYIVPIARKVQLYNDDENEFTCRVSGGYGPGEIHNVNEPVSSYIDSEQMSSRYKPLNMTDKFINVDSVRRNSPYTEYYYEVDMITGTIKKVNDLIVIPRYSWEVSHGIDDVRNNDLSNVPDSLLSCVKDPRRIPEHTISINYEYYNTTPNPVISDPTPGSSLPETIEPMYDAVARVGDIQALSPYSYDKIWSRNDYTDFTAGGSGRIFDTKTGEFCNSYLDVELGRRYDYLYYTVDGSYLFVRLNAPTEDNIEPINSWETLGMAFNSCVGPVIRSVQRMSKPYSTWVNRAGKYYDLIDARTTNFIPIMTELPGYFGSIYDEQILNAYGFELEDGSTFVLKGSFLYPNISMLKYPYKAYTNVGKMVLCDIDTDRVGGSDPQYENISSTYFRDTLTYAHNYGGVRNNTRVYKKTLSVILEYSVFNSNTVNIEQLNNDINDSIEYSITDNNIDNISDNLGYTAYNKNIYSSKTTLKFICPTPIRYDGKKAVWTLQFKVKVYVDAQCIQLITEINSQINPELFKLNDAPFPPSGASSEDYGKDIFIDVEVGPRKKVYIKIDVGANDG